MIFAVFSGLGGMTDWHPGTATEYAAETRLNQKQIAMKRHTNFVYLYLARTDVYMIII